MDLDEVVQAGAVDRMARREREAVGEGDCGNEEIALPPRLSPGSAGRRDHLTEGARCCVDRDRVVAGLDLWRCRSRRARSEVGPRFGHVVEVGAQPRPVQGVQPARDLGQSAHVLFEG